MKDEGMALIAALVMLLALTIMGTLMINTMSLQSRASGAQKEDAQAILLAEAGVAKVREWFQHPGDPGEVARFSPTQADIDGGITMPASNGGFKDCTSINPSSVSDMSTCPVVMLNAASAVNLFKRRFIEVNKREYIANSLSEFTDAKGSGTQLSSNRLDKGGNDTPALDITNQGYLNNLFNEFSGIGRITEIQIFPPMGGGSSGPLADPPSPRPICTVRVTARTNTGLVKVIESEIWESLIFPITAGAEAKAAAGWNGNGNVYWGNVLSKGNVSLDYNALLARCNGSNTLAWPTGDPWSTIRVTGSVSASQGNPTPCTASDCLGDCTNRPWQNDAVYQNQTSVLLDTWDNNTMKSYAIEMGGYFKTSDGTTVYPCDPYGNQVGGAIQFSDLLNEPDRPPFIYVDAQSAPDQLLSLKNNYFTEGDMYIWGNLDMSGGGNGQDITAIDPSGQPQQLANVNIDGAIYITGNLTGSGGQTIYGGVVAEGALQDSGTPNIYFDQQLMNGRKRWPRTSKGRWREVM